VESFKQVNANVMPKLEFNNYKGEWCTDTAGGNRCVSWPGIAPNGAVGDANSFDVVAVSNFDGQYKGMGTPVLEGGEVTAFRAPAKGMRQKRKTAADLAKLELQNPTYAGECRREGSFPDAVADGLGYSYGPDSSDIYEKVDGYDNPCKEAGRISWTADDVYTDVHRKTWRHEKALGLQGSEDMHETTDGDYHEGLNEEYPMKDLNGCKAREVKRGFLQTRMDFNHGLLQRVLGLTDLGSSLAHVGCSLIPNPQMPFFALGCR
jgi:hypothetical protein